MSKPYDSIYMTWAHARALSSKDPRTKVGAILVSPDQRHVASGYNGFPPAVYDFPAVYAREDTIPGTTLGKDDVVVHAEINALLNVGCSVAGWTLYCTHRPCIQCAKAILAARIGRIVHGGLSPTTDHKDDKAEALCIQAGVPYECHTEHYFRKET